MARATLSAWGGAILCHSIWLAATTAAAAELDIQVQQTGSFGRHLPADPHEQPHSTPAAECAVVLARAKPNLAPRTSAHLPDDTRTHIVPTGRHTHPHKPRPKTGEKPEKHRSRRSTAASASRPARDPAAPWSSGTRRAGSTRSSPRPRPRAMASSARPPRRVTVRRVAVDTVVATTPPRSRRRRRGRDDAAEVATPRRRQPATNRARDRQRVVGGPPAVR